MTPTEAIRQIFFQECEEQLAELETGLMRMEDGAADPEIVNAVFRAVHSIKGGAGAFALDELVRFAHVFETTLDDIRNGARAADGQVMRVMLLASDVLADLVRAARVGGQIDPERARQVSAQLAAFRGGAAEPQAADDDGFEDFDFQPAPVLLDINEPAATVAASVPSPGWRLTFTPRADLYAKANETARLLRELRAVGPCVVSLDAGRLPAFDALDPEGAYLTWIIDVTTDRPEASVREIFEFVEWDCELDVAPMPVDPSTLEPFEVRMIAPTTPVPEASAEIGAPPTSASEGEVKSPPPDPQAVASTPPATIRVDLDRVDRLINLVGELIINQAMLAQSLRVADIGRHTALAADLEELEQLSRGIQDSVMAIRAQPVKSVFQRMPRLVREVAAMTGKQVRLITDGENTEVDKTVIERIADPLTHMIRNAIDHGLETSEARLAAGKPAEGTVHLSALHRSGRIVIEVADDGAGIDRARVRQIAVERGLVEPDAALTDDEIDNLIFMPGFSTANQLSDISGRGVGMDVVRRSIQGLGGRISIASIPGAGSTFTMSLPLTLAVLDGMVVTVGDQTLIAPLSAIVETLKPTEADVRPLGQTARVIRNRNQFVPLIDIGCALGFRTVPPPATSGVALLIETDGGGRAALQVDSIDGQRQVVIKSLEANYHHVPGIAAATILGDGRVALILDIDTIESAARDAAAKQQLRPRLALAG